MRYWLILAAFGMVVASCGSGGTEEPTPTVAEATAEPTVTALAVGTEQAADLTQATNDDDGERDIGDAAFVIVRSIIWETDDFAADDPAVTCLVDAIERDGISADVPTLAASDSLASFLPLPPLSPRLAELAADCVLADDRAAVLAAGLQADGITLAPGDVECLRATFGAAETRAAYVDLLTSEVPGPTVPELLEGAFSACLEDALAGPQPDAADVRVDGAVSAERVAAYFAQRALDLSAAEVACIVAGIDAGTFDESDLSRQVLGADPSCIEASTIAASFNGQQGEPILDESHGACMLAALRDVAVPDRALAVCLTPTEFAEVLDRGDPGARATREDEAECVISLVLDGATIAEAVPACID